MFVASFVSHSVVELRGDLLDGHLDGYLFLQSVQYVGEIDDLSQSS